MADPEIRIPASLGLSKEELERIKQGFQNQLADMIKGTQAKAAARARPKSVGEVKTQVVSDAK